MRNRTYFYLDAEVKMYCVRVLWLCLFVVFIHPSQEDEHHHNIRRFSSKNLLNRAHEDESTANFWHLEAEASIRAKISRNAGHDKKSARNVVMFLGDGMSVPTLTAARTLLGQRNGETGEEANLSFEMFPTIGLSKTYCVDAQIADSACSASAYLCGAKANYGTIGVNAKVERLNCETANDAQNHLHSIVEMALADGRDTGIVTTTRVTHASPAGVYAHTAERDWESDSNVISDCGSSTQEDIALQLIHSYPGNKLKVIMGGGRREFLSNSTIDEEGTQGHRYDGRNLIEEWQMQKIAENASYQYVWNRNQLMEAAKAMPEYLLGLFEGSHMHYHMQANPETEPTLAEMTEVAIKSLSRNEKGFFLFVEGGRIDQAHHENWVHMALDETIEMSKAVARAAELLSEEDSLIVVTSDHAHVMSLNGYTGRGSDILGPSTLIGDDGVPYMTLSYANGPGYRDNTEEGIREDISQHDYKESSFRYPTMVPLDSETHGGDDVAVLRTSSDTGPQHGMFSGMYEQSQIPHIMAYAACIGPGPHVCDEQ